MLQTFMIVLAISSEYKMAAAVLAIRCAFQQEQRGKIRREEYYLNEESKSFLWNFFRNSTDNYVYVPLTNTRTYDQAWMESR